MNRDTLYPRTVGLYWRQIKKQLAVHYSMVNIHILVWEILLKRLWHYTDRKINLMVNIDELPLFTSSSLQLWPILTRFSSFKPVPVALYCGYKKLDMGKYLGEFVDEMEVTQRPFGSKWFKLWIIYLHIHLWRTSKSSIERDSAIHSIFFVWKMLNERNKYQMSYSIWQNWSTLRSNDTFMSMGYAEKDEIGKSHQLAPLPLRRLNFNMINGFNLNYMHMVCLGGEADAVLF